MKTTSLLTALLTTILLSCNNPKTNQSIEKVNADILLNNIENYSNRKIEIEGYIVHVCGVDGMKMKLKTENGEIIKIVPFDSTLKFDGSYYKKTIRVQGKITESRLVKHLVDSLDKEKTLLCHIDNTPCKDKGWIENQIRKGISDSLSKKDIERLNEKMLKTGKDYISIFTILAEKILIID
jgi:hypothetical protein